jgi:hypothetical protein
MGESFHDNSLSTTTPEQWRIECELVVCCAGKLLRLARRSYTSSAIIELVRTMPRSEEEIESLKRSAENAFDGEKRFSAHPSLFIRCVVEAYHFSDHEKDLFHAIVAYWNDFVRMPPERRAMLEASVVGTIFGNGMG